MKAAAARYIAIPVVAWLVSGACALSADRQPVLIDTDVGTDINDAFALGFGFGSFELDVLGVTTVGDDTRQKAMMMCRFLTMTGRRHTRVAAGEQPQPSRPITDQHKYFYHPDALFDRTTKPADESAAEFLGECVKQQPGAVTIVAIGPLTNVARLLASKAVDRAFVRRIVLLESNIQFDVEAARKVLGSGIPLVIVTTEACKDLTLDDTGVNRVFAPGTALSRQVQAMYQMWDRRLPSLDETLAVAFCFEDRFASAEPRSLTLDEKGALHEQQSGAKVHVVASVKRKEFVEWYLDRMGSLVSPENRPSHVIQDDKLPYRVHVAEDFDTDIERRWWMSGKPELKLLPEGSKRACRSVLTHDFDDLLMASRQMYSAVIFNPVPGPPMGRNTRLRFRYLLKGTDTIRVQIYSLTNGYHRHLVVKDLRQARWQNAVVDMTEARRPDGTGGPLGENERIDDIQFYVNPSAEVIVDDIVLYDAAASGEAREFPRRVVFAGGFDTGQLGKEWPGEFEIVADAGNFWRAARSIPLPKSDETGMRIGLRGQRRLGAKSRVSFRYRASGTDAIHLRLVNSESHEDQSTDIHGLKQGAWAETAVEFETKQLASIDAIHLRHAPKTEFMIDDLVVSDSSE